MSEREAWFEYWNDGRRFKAMPINWKGWVSLILVASAPGVSMSLGARWLGDRYGAFVGLPALMLTLTISFTIIILLVRTKGRKRRD
jgi:hypothetical protein